MTSVTHSVRNDPWLSRRRPRPGVRLRLCCLPHAGGGTALYHRWSDQLPPAIEVVAAQLPGRENRVRETPVDRLPAVVDAVAAALRPLLDLPLALFGHSMGALLAFELARVLRREHGLSPAALIVAACRAPHLDFRRHPLRHLPDGQFLHEVRKFGGVADVVWNNTAFMRLLLPAMRADIAVVETYEYRDEPPLACPILALAGREDHEMAVAEVAEWERHTSGRFHLETFPGGHFFVHTPQAGTVSVVQRWLAEYPGAGMP